MLNRAAERSFCPPAEIVPGGEWRTWWLRALSACCVGYILASQGLVFFSGWSRLGFLIAALTIILLGVGFCLRVVQLRPGAWVGLALLFVAYCALRSVPEPGQQWPLDSLFKLGSVFLGAIAVGLSLQAGVSFKAVVWAQTIIFLGNVVAGLCGMGMEPPSEVEAGRQAGLTGNANELAMQLSLGACLVWLAPKKSGAFFSVLAVAAVGYAILMTGSRKSLIVLAFFLLIVLTHAVVTFKWHRSRAALLACGGVLALGLVIGPGFLQLSRNVSTVQRTLEYRDSSFEKRMDMTRQAVRLWKEAPVAGWGLDAFSRISGFGFYAHNNLAELLCDLGLAGILFFYALYGYILLKALRLPMPLGLCCVLLVVLLLVVDTGMVTYIRKQSVMVVMILASIVANPQIILGRPLKSFVPGSRAGAQLKSHLGRCRFWPGVQAPARAFTATSFAHSPSQPCSARSNAQNNAVNEQC